jgi:hypothetical protein
VNGNALVRLGGVKTWVVATGRLTTVWTTVTVRVRVGGVKTCLGVGVGAALRTISCGGVKDCVTGRAWPVTTPVVATPPETTTGVAGWTTTCCGGAWTT